MAPQKLLPGGFVLPVWGRIDSSFLQDFGDKVCGIAAPPGSGRPILTRVWTFNGELLFFDSLSVFPGGLSGTRRRRVDSDQMKFSPIQEFPLDLLSRFQTDCRGEGDREVDVELGFLPFGADGLNFK
jgi:hypothetical protein